MLSAGPDPAVHGVPSEELCIKVGGKKLNFGFGCMQRPAPDLHLNQFYFNNIIHSPLISHLSFLAPTFLCVYVGLGRIWPPNVNMKENHDNTAGREVSFFFFFRSSRPAWHRMRCNFLRSLFFIFEQKKKMR